MRLCKQTFLASNYNNSRRPGVYQYVILSSNLSCEHQKCSKVSSAHGTVVNFPPGGHVSSASTIAIKRREKPLACRFHVNDNEQLNIFSSIWPNHWVTPVPLELQMSNILSSKWLCLAVVSHLVRPFIIPKWPSFFCSSAQPSTAHEYKAPPTTHTPPHPTHPHTNSPSVC